MPIERTEARQLAARPGLSLTATTFKFRAAIDSCRSGSPSDAHTLNVSAEPELPCMLSLPVSISLLRRLIISPGRRLLILWSMTLYRRTGKFILLINYCPDLTSSFVAF
jgi:hypothetical protein